MKITKEIDVRLQKEYIAPKVDVVQFNDTLELILNFKDFEIPSGTTATLFVEKPSRKFVYQNCTVSSNKKITIQVNNQALAEYGRVYAQVRMSNGGYLSTFDIVLNVKKSRADTNAVESKNIISAFDEKAAELLKNLGIDTSFTKAGLAADAKAVGDGLAKKVNIFQGASYAGKALIIDQNGNVTVGEAGVQVDTSFTIAGKAADAKATGDKFNKLQSDLAKSMSDFETATNASIAELEGKINTNKTNTDNAISNLESGVNTKVTTLQTSVETKLTEQQNAVETQLQNMSNNVTTKLAEFSQSFDSEFEQLGNKDMELNQMMTLISEAKVDDAFVGEDGCLYLTSNGEVVAGPLGPFAGSGGGGSGGPSNNAVISITNTSGWLMNTVIVGSDVNLSFTWSSLEEGLATGNGSLKVTINGAIRVTTDIPQGDHTVNIGKYLSNSNNSIRITVTDVYGNSKSINYSVNVIQAYIGSTFDASIPYRDAINFVYTPTGALTKKMHFILDGEEIGTADVTVSGRQQTFIIPKQSHGAHTFRVYFTAEANGSEFKSNELYYELICVETGLTTPIVTLANNITEASQYQTVAIQYYVYDPSSMLAPVELKVDSDLVSSLTVDRTKQTWAYLSNKVGTFNLSITCKGVTKRVRLEVKKGEVDAEIETQDLALYLSSNGRSNNEANPSKWDYENVHATLTGFNFKSDGWQLDEDNATVLRVNNNARVTIPYQIFKGDIRTTGKTIEFVFSTKDVRDYDTPMISCYSNGRGIVITPKMARLNSEQSEVFSTYKEDKKYHIAFVIEKRSEYRLLSIYIEGVQSGTLRYPETDDFTQVNPVGISIGSDKCTVDIYSIRVYNNNLNRFQLLNNWIAETRDVNLMIARFRRNNIFDDYGDISIDKLPKDTPYMVVVGGTLPQYKGDKKTVSGYYVDQIRPELSFSFTGCEIDVQGTSSQYYKRKNYKMKFKSGFTMTASSEQASTYKMREESIPTSTFTMKADVASCEGANNVELVRLYDDTCPFKMPSQIANPSVRQGIDGYPMVMFWDNGSKITFLGKYNFNNDKGTPEVFGFKSGDESWETLNNTSTRVLYQSADFSGNDWQNDFEARYPDGNTNVSKLSRFAAWVASTKDNPTKFKNELSQYASIDSSVYMYLFTEVFLMVDSRAKNSFPTLLTINGKVIVCWLPYDMDTAIGINNEGLLVFSYDLEDIDHLDGGADVFNGQNSVFWKNMRTCFFDEIKAMYQKLRSDGTFSYNEVIRRFDEHQSKWSEAIFNEDAYFKYLQPLFEENNGTYLGMLQGTKAAQREWWLYNRFRYMDSKYNAGDALSDTIVVRGYAKGDITVTPYASVYATVKYGSYLQQQRALAGESVTLPCPMANVNDTEIITYSASQLASIGDLSPLKVGFADFTNGIKLQSIKVGDASSSYSNPNMTELYLGNNVLLKSLDVRNCTNLRTSVDISGCANIEEVYFDGTAVASVSLPNGGNIRKLHLPSTVTNLTVLNQQNIEEFVMPSYANITTFRIENCSDTIDIRAILNTMPANGRVRIIGFDWDLGTFDNLKTFTDLLDRMRGMDANGNNMDIAQVYGTVRIRSVTGDQLDEVQTKYPDIKIIADTASFYLRYCTWDGGTVLTTQTITKGGNGTYSGSPSRSSDAQYTYSFTGWSLYTDGEADPNATKNITANRRVYAAYTKTIRTYTIRFLNASGAVLQSSTLAYGSTPVYTGSTPVYDGTETSDFGSFIGWSPTISKVTGAVDYKAQFEDTSDPVKRYLSGQQFNRITDSELPNLTRIRSYGLQYSIQYSIHEFNLPYLKYIGAYAIGGLHYVHKLDLYDVEYIGRNAITNISNCVAIILRNHNKVCILDSNNFIACSGNLKIYVPNDLLQNYITATNWSRLANKIVPIEGSVYDIV